MSRAVRVTSILIALLALTGALQAQVTPERASNVADKEYQHPDLTISAFHDEVGQLPPQAAAQAQERLTRLGVDAGTARVDRRSGRFTTLTPTEPLVPGAGVGNHLLWTDLKVAGTPSRAVREKAAGDAFLAYLDVHQADLGIDPVELTSLRVTSYGEDLFQIYAGRTFDGVPVRDSSLTAVVGQGNLTLFGAHQWGDRTASSNRPQLSSEEAHAAAVAYLSPLTVTGEWGAAELVYVPMARGQAPVDVGNGYSYEPVWSVKLNVEGDGGNWELLVGAYDGQVLAHQDTNQYAEIKGGVYPVSNDGVLPDGIELAGWPMPFQDVTDGITNQTADTGGNVTLGGNLTATFNGPYVSIFDNCGAASLTQAGGVDWGASAGTNCTTPGFGGGGNTHSARSGFYELNKMKEMARGQLPTNPWLQADLTANMNINNSCNAYWNGSTVNFYRSGGGCANTGEIAGVFDHEWGHGMDANDATPGISGPSGEGIADVYVALRLNTSCIGRGFLSSNCSGYGDPCLSCTGVRDIDYLQHASGLPHTYTWRNATCGGGVHCSGIVYSEAIWSLWKRKLQSAPYSLDDYTAHEIVNRLTFIAAGNTSVWFSGGPPNGGCAAASGYMNFLAADDDNGTLGDGTPHMQAIFDAFNDQEIACPTPTVQDRGCAGAPTSAPNVTVTPGNNSATLTWTAVPGTDHYDIFRTEGVHGCDFGKVRLGDTMGTTWTDTGLQNGRNYYYIVIPMGTHPACFGLSSACASVVPQCISDADCDDGLFCNGAEACVAGSCVPGSDPCPGQTCDETFASAAATAAASAQASADALAIAWATADAHASASAFSCSAASASASSISVSWSAAQASATAAADATAEAQASAASAAFSCSGALAAANAWASACASCQCASACANASASAFAAAAACGYADASAQASADASASAEASASASAAALGIAYASADAWSVACAAAAADASASASALAIAYAQAQANATAAAQAVADAQAAACGTNCSAVAAAAAASAQAYAQANAFALAAAFAHADAAAYAGAIAWSAAQANADAQTAAFSVANAAAEAEASANASADASAQADAGAGSIALALAQGQASAVVSCDPSCVKEVCCTDETTLFCVDGEPVPNEPPVVHSEPTDPVQ